MFGGNNVLYGNVAKGAGEGAFFMSLEPYLESMEEKLGFVPFKGTLNIRVEKQQAKNFIDSLQLITVKGFKKGIKEFGYVNCYLCRIKHLKCAIIMPEFTRYGLDTIEVVSETELRKNLYLKDGDKIKIELK